MPKKKIKKDELKNMTLKDLYKLQNTLNKTAWKVRVAIARKEMKLGATEPKVH